MRSQRVLSGPSICSESPRQKSESAGSAGSVPQMAVQAQFRCSPPLRCVPRVVRFLSRCCTSSSNELPTRSVSCKLSKTVFLCKDQRGQLFTSPRLNEIRHRKITRLHFCVSQRRKTRPLQCAWLPFLMYLVSPMYSRTTGATKRAQWHVVETRAVPAVPRGCRSTWPT